MKTETKDIKPMDGYHYEDTRHLLPRFRGDRAAKVSPWLRGVFEGGGAKGVAYCGALKAVEEHGCWFEAAAGSSAGAITAALIAAGYSPREFDEPMKQLLELFQLPGVFKAVKSLRSTGEIFSGDAFRKKLDELLRWKCDLFGVDLGAGELTFRKLHDATGVDLYVVAADISRQEPVVFHHLYTPECQVADAVLASASIPFAFDAGMLTTKTSIVPPDPKANRNVGHQVFRTIVDGGVWTNFPMFVFKDPTFHEYMARALGLDQDSGGSSAGPVVGFLLHELVDDEGGNKDDEKRLEEASAAYRGARFVRGTPLGSWLVPIEQTDRNVQSDEGPTHSMKSGGSGRYGPNARRWPNPRREIYRVMLVLVDKSLAWASMTGSLAIVLIGVAVAELFLFAVPGRYILEAIREGWAKGGWDFTIAVLMASTFFGFYMAQLFSVVVLFVGAWLGNWALLLPARRVLYGVATTLVATPGTSPWEHLHPDVIALEIPESLTTLRVPDDTTRDEVIRRAKAKTEERLPTILEAFGGRHGS